MMLWDAHLALLRETPGAALWILAALVLALLALWNLIRAFLAAAGKAAAAGSLTARFFRLSTQRAQAGQSALHASADEARDAVRVFGIRARKIGSVLARLAACVILAAAAGISGLLYATAFTYHHPRSAHGPLLVAHLFLSESEAAAAQGRLGPRALALKPGWRFMAAHVVMRPMPGWLAVLGHDSWHRVESFAFYSFDPVEQPLRKPAVRRLEPETGLPFLCRSILEKAFGGPPLLFRSEPLPIQAGLRDLACEDEHYYWRYAEGAGP